MSNFSLLHSALVVSLTFLPLQPGWRNLLPINLAVSVGHGDGLDVSKTKSLLQSLWIFVAMPNVQQISKGKGKGRPINMTWGDEDTAALILNLGARWRWLLNTQTVFPPGKSFGTRSIRGWVGLRDSLDVSEMRKSPASAGIRTPDLAVRSLVAIQSTL